MLVRLCESSTHWPELSALKIGGAAFSDYLGAATSAKPGAGAAEEEDVLLVPRNAWLSAAAIAAFGAAGARDRQVVRFTGRDADLVAVYVPKGTAVAATEALAQAWAGSDPAPQSNVRFETIAASDTDVAPVPRLVRSYADVAEIERALLRDRAERAIARGVRVHDPASFFIRGELSCGANVEIDVNVIVEGKVTLGDNVRIGANCILIECSIAAGTRVNPYSIVDHADVGANSFVGPYGRLRPGTRLGEAVQVGNFVEIKNADVGDGTRINHLAFIGDATVGVRVTIGAGTITCNHGKAGISHTAIGDNAYIGSGTELVAPVTIGADAVVGAGSTITKSVPPKSLVLARAPQRIVEKREATERTEVTDSST